MDGELGGDSSNSSSMFSSMFIDSIMNTSMHIAQECMLNSDQDDETDHQSAPPESPQSNEKTKTNTAATSNLLGLEAFASTIDSILSRIKITLEQIQIRVENMDGSVLGSFSDMSSDAFSSSSSQAPPFMSSSTIFNQKPSNGVALELRIKSIKYFDLDSVNNSNSGSANSTPGNSLDHQSSGQVNKKI